MTAIRFEDLRREHFSVFSRIEAVAGFDDETFREVVWETKRLLPGCDHLGAKARTLFVYVPSLSEACLERLRTQITKLVSRPSRADGDQGARRTRRS
jgi:hypothetical protein